jgi:site-specific DNA-cytosine methylase
MLLKKIDYLPFLESCWLEHLRPKTDNAPTVISTFAGCGGSSLGYSMAGFRELLANEWDDNACETFSLNFPDKPSSTQIKSHLNWHYAVARQLTETEAGLIGSFPEEFKWVGKTQDYKQRIGNPVPPLFMRSIAKHIRTNILDKLVKNE